MRRTPSAAAVAVALGVAVAAAVAGVFAVDNGLGLVPPLGWNTWCTEGACGRDVCNENEIREIADTIRDSGLRDLGFVWISLDDCWGGPRAADGSYTADPTRFPSGMKALADYLHQNGFRLGVYTDSGLYTCSSGGRSYRIPGSYGHYEQDAMTFASWGVDLLKMDWCNTLLPNGTQLDPFVQYPQMSAALNATGRPIYFTACEWGRDSPWEWMAPYANDWRATNDHHDVWWDSVYGTALLIEQAADLAAYAGPGHWNFLDFIYPGGQGCANNPVPGAHCPGQTDTEYVTEATIWTIAASGLIFATDPRNMTAIQQRILFNTELIAIHQDPAARAGGRVGYSQCVEGELHTLCQVWARPLAGGDYAVALYNAGAVAHDITVPWQMVDQNWTGRTVYLRDVWAHEDLGGFMGQYTASQVPRYAPHRCCAFGLGFWLTVNPVSVRARVRVCVCVCTSVGRQVRVDICRNRKLQTAAAHGLGAGDRDDGPAHARVPQRGHAKCEHSTGCVGTACVGSCGQCGRRRAIGRIGTAQTPESDHYGVEEQCGERPQTGDGPCQ